MDAGRLTHPSSDTSSDTRSNTHSDMLSDPPPLFATSSVTPTTIPLTHPLLPTVFAGLGTGPRPVLRFNRSSARRHLSLRRVDHIVRGDEGGTYQVDQQSTHTLHPPSQHIIAINAHFQSNPSIKKINKQIPITIIILNALISADLGSYRGINDHNLVLDRKWADVLFRGLIEDYYFNQSNKQVMWNNTESRIYQMASGYGIPIKTATMCQFPLIPLRANENR